MRNQETIAFRLDTSTGMDIGIALLPERLDHTRSGQLEREFTLWLQKTHHLVFDCSRLEFLDSSALGTIVASLRKTLEKQGDIKLAGLGRTAAMLFELTRAKKLFSIHPDTASALESFSKRGEGEGEAR